MPRPTLLIILTSVIDLAAATVAGLAMFVEGLVAPPMVVLGVITVLSLLASLALRRFARSGDRS